MGFNYNYSIPLYFLFLNIHLYFMFDTLCYKVYGQSKFKKFYIIVIRYRLCFEYVKITKHSTTFSRIQQTKGSTSNKCEQYILYFYKLFKKIVGRPSVKTYELFQISIDNRLLPNDNETIKANLSAHQVSLMFFISVNNKLCIIIFRQHDEFT